MTGPLRHSPLDDAHRAAGARLAAFGGWEMPIQYAGVLEEHRACREHAAVFDVSHLGSLEVAGPAAFDSLQWAFTNDLHRIAPGRAQYSHLLDPRDAHVVDDVIVWWTGEDAFLVMPNASNTEPLAAAMRDAVRAHGNDAARVRDVTAGRAVLAVQGPHARASLASLWPVAADVARFAVVALPELGEAWAAGTGYTGEDGVELHVPADRAAGVWDAIVDAGVTPAGLGARDTLRLEAGLPLHGHELGPGITPLQAGLGWVVRFDKGDFRGRAPLIAERDRGVARRLRGLAVDGRQIVREGSTVRRGEVVVGSVTSGNFSPTLGRPIALAFLPSDAAVGDEFVAEVRGREVPVTVTELPFVHR